MARSRGVSIRRGNIGGRPDDVQRGQVPVDRNEYGPLGASVRQGYELALQIQQISIACQSAPLDLKAQFISEIAVVIQVARSKHGTSGWIEQCDFDPGLSFLRHSREKIMAADFAVDVHMDPDTF